MLAWLCENAATVIIAAVLVAAVIIILVKMVRDKRQGRSSCGCGCSSCAMRGSCHKTK